MTQFTTRDRQNTGLMTHDCCDEWLHDEPDTQSPDLHEGRVRHAETRHTGEVMNALIVDAATARELFNDQVGFCLSCGSMDHPVSNDATGKPCDTCGKLCMVGMDLALESGAVRVSLENAA